MKVARIAVVEFSDEINEFWLSHGVYTASAEVIILETKIEKSKSTLLLASIVKLNKALKKNAIGDVIVPEVELTTAEVAIECVSNLISVSENVGRKIASPNPCVIFIAENKNEEEWLLGCEGVEGKVEPKPSIKSRVEPEQMLDIAKSRMDGVALMSEALSCDNSSAKFKEFIRVFELAFKRENRGLIKPLSKFLNNCNRNYSENEIEKWISFYRHKSIHANGSEFLLEAHINTIIHRVEQAAYEVLLTKTEWGNASTNRTSTWGSTDVQFKSKNNYVTRNYDIKVISVTMDERGAYPLTLGFGCTFVTLPVGWWAFRKGQNEAGFAELLSTNEVLDAKIEYTLEEKRIYRPISNTPE